VNERVLAWVRKHKWKAPWAGGGLVAAVVAWGLIAADSPHGPNICDQTPLRHVYAPQRLQVVETCKEADVTVISWRHEQDGDWHVNVRADDGTLINGVNMRRQHGLLVLEWVPGDRKPAKFVCGQRMHVLGTYVLDRQHGGWAEIHPIFRFNDLHENTGCTAKTKRMPAPPTEESDAVR